jgi:hypothetical protein
MPTANALADEEVFRLPMPVMTLLSPCAKGAFLIAVTKLHGIGSLRGN